MADNDDLTAEFKAGMAAAVAHGIAAEMAGDLRNTPALHAGDTVEVWEEYSPRQAPIRRGTVKTIGNTTGPLIVVLEEQATS